MKLVEAGIKDRFSLTFENGIESPSLSLNGMTFDGEGCEFAHEGDLIIAIGEFLIEQGKKHKNKPTKRIHFSNMIEGFKKGQEVAIKKAP